MDTKKLSDSLEKMKQIEETRFVAYKSILSVTIAIREFAMDSDGREKKGEILEELLKLLNQLEVLYQTVNEFQAAYKAVIDELNRK